MISRLTLFVLPVGDDASRATMGEDYERHGFVFKATSYVSPISTTYVLVQ